jgi:hypothetical protein
MDETMPVKQIKNPTTGLESFGSIPDVVLGRQLFESCEIILLEGHHRGPNSGYGLQHIWAEHTREMQQVGFMEQTDVPHYVLSILRSGTPLFYEGANLRKMRLMAVRATKGTVILEYVQRREGAVWSIVTAFSGTKAHGTRVGAVR